MVRSVDQILKTEFGGSRERGAAFFILSRCPHHRPVCGNGQFHRADYARNSQDRADGKIHNRIALQRGDAAAVLYCLNEH